MNQNIYEIIHIQKDRVKKVTVFILSAVLPLPSMTSLKRRGNLVWTIGRNIFPS